MGPRQARLVELIAVAVVLAGASAGDCADRHREPSSGGACADESGLVQLMKSDGHPKASNPCLECSLCVAVPTATQGGVTDKSCAPCAKGGQSYWPCNASPE